MVLLNEQPNKATVLMNLYKNMVPDYLMESKVFSVCFVGLDGKYSYTNELFKKRLSFKYDEITGVDALDAIYEEDHLKTQETVGHCFANLGIPYQVEIRKPSRRPNRYVSTHWDFIGMADENGDPQGILCVGYDTTKKMDLIEKIESQNIRLSNFAQTITHNFKSSSNNLSILLRMIKENLPDDEQQNSYLDMMGTAIKKLETTIEHLNETINVNFNTGNKKEDLKVLPIVESIVASHTAILKDMDVKVSVTVPKDFQVFGIEAYLDSVIHNLFTNALKYRDEAKECTVEIGAEEDAFEKRFWVQDNGLGMDLEKYGEKLFGMYRTFHGNENAVGMGLYLTKNQIEVMDGDIHVESEVGKGTKFTVTFDKTTKS